MKTVLRGLFCCVKFPYAKIRDDNAGTAYAAESDRFSLTNSAITFCMVSRS